MTAYCKCPLRKCNEPGAAECRREMGQTAMESIRRTYEIGRDIGVLVPHPLSKPATRMPSTDEILVKERAQLVRRLDPAPTMPLGHSVALLVGIAILLGLAVALILERMA